MSKKVAIIAGITRGIELAIKPIAKPTISLGFATDNKYVICENFYTSQDENYVNQMVLQLIAKLKE